MKNSILYLISISFAVLLLASCSKEQIKNDTGALATDQQSSTILKLIRAFDTKLSTGFKSGESLNIDSAVWYAEALQNYNHARPDQQYEATKVSKQTYALTIENGQLGMDDMATLYQNIDNDRVQQMSALGEGDNYLKLTDVNLDSVVGTTAYLSSTNVFGLRLIEGLYLPFQEGDDWIWGTLSQQYGAPPAGKCDGSMYGVSDASDELAWKLNHPAISTVPYVFVSCTTYTAVGFDYDERLYVGWNYPQNNCLTSDTLNYYLQQSHLIINDPAEGLRPPGKEFCNVEIIDELVMSSTNSWHIHFYNVSYGIKIISGQQEE